MTIPPATVRVRLTNAVARSVSWLAISTVAPVAIAIMFVFGAHAFVWGTTSVTVRQRAVPIELQGRVGSVNSLGTYGGLVVGAALGGVIANHWGVTAPFWFAFVGSGVFVILIWRQLTHITDNDEPETRSDDADRLPSGFPTASG